MKKKITLILMAFVMLIMAGCQKTSYTPAELTKGQAMVLDAAQSGSAVSSQLSSLELPEKFTGDWSGVDGCVVVHADAEIDLPDVASVPTAIIERKPFSQADADRMLEVFTKGNTLWQEQGITKQMAQEQLEHYQAIERGEIPYEHDGTIDRVPELIKHYEELVKTAPDESERFTAPTTFQTTDEWNDGRIKGYAEAEGRVVHVDIFNTSLGCDQACFYVDGYGDVNSCSFYGEEEGVNPGLTEKDAIEMGNALMKEVGNGNFVCSQIRPVAYFNNAQTTDKGIFDSGYEMEFVRTVNGFPIAHCPQYEISPSGDTWIIPSLTGTASPENEQPVGYWGYERITIYVNEDGVVYFSWQNPYSEPEIQTADAQLMSFSDVSDIFAKMIMVKNSNQKVINEKNGFVVINNIDIDKVSLNMMRIRDKNNYEQGLLVPVWDFWGTISYELEDEAYRDVVYNGKYYSIHLTVNAIDGTIIDRELGY